MKRLLEQLAAKFRGAITAGATWSGELVDGELVAEVTVTIRRRVTSDAARGYREGAIAELTKNTHRVKHCGCYVQRRSSWGGTLSATCSGRVVAAVVYTATLRGELGYQFVCSRHAEKPQIRAEFILGVVEFSEIALRPIRAQDEAQDEVNEREFQAKWRREQEEREAARGRAEKTT